MPVLVDVSGAWPGRPVPAWPALAPGEVFSPPTGRGVQRLMSDSRKGRCQHCRRSTLLRVDGTVISHDSEGRRCRGSGEPPTQDAPLAAWLPVLPDLTPHGLRHGHQTWLEQAGIPYVLISERMGHEVPGMRGTYSHVSPGMRADLTACLQQLWEDSISDRSRLAPHSPVAVVDSLLAEL